MDQKNISSDRIECTSPWISNSRHDQAARLLPYNKQTDHDGDVAIHGESESKERSEERPEPTEMNDESNTLDVAMADGGLVVREFSDIGSAELVREYKTPPGHRLYAYRDDDGDHHIVVSRGGEPGTRWEKRIPATVKRPVPGQKRWTIPDNWEQHVYSRRDSIAYALYYVPESDVWARVSIPTNDWLTDAWYGVQALSDLDVESVGELGSSYDVRQFADEYEEKYDVEGIEKEAEAFRVIADNWAFVEEDLSLATEWLQDDGLCEMWAGDRCARADNNWRIEVSQDPIFLPDKALKEVTSLSEYDIPVVVHPRETPKR